MITKTITTIRELQKIGEYTVLTVSIVVSNYFFGIEMESVTSIISQVTV